jgi:hypothetical protein
MFNQHPLLQPGTIDTTTSAAAAAASSSTAASSADSGDGAYSQDIVKALVDLRTVRAEAAARPMSVQQFSDLAAQQLYEAVRASSGGPHYEAGMQLRMHCQNLCLELLPVCVSRVHTR